jgi:pimeloyl-ACP methyl ester carboxylesterase
VTAQEWWGGGANHALTIDGITRRVFICCAGSGPTVTLLHGFPGSSLEWSGAWERLIAEHRVIAVDLLGFGHSDKPRGHRYRLDHQADLVLAVWRELGVERTSIVAYDYGAIIAQLLINRADRPQITRVVLSNASVFPELYRPRPLQRALLLPGLGRLVWRLTDESRSASSYIARESRCRREPCRLPGWRPRVSPGSPPPVPRRRRRSGSADRLSVDHDQSCRYQFIAGIMGKPYQSSRERRTQDMAR